EVALPRPSPVRRAPSDPPGGEDAGRDGNVDPPRGNGGSRPRGGASARQAPFPRPAVGAVRATGRRGTVAGHAAVERPFRRSLLRSARGPATARLLAADERPRKAGVGTGADARPDGVPGPAALRVVGGISP